MFKRFISSLGIMLFAFSINVGAQSIQAQKLSAGKLMPKYSAQQVTSKIDIQDDEFWGGYWNGLVDDHVSMLGMQATPETYDAAICYPAGSPSITGMTMQGIRFSFSGAKHIKDVKVWMSTTLPVLPEDADIIVQEVTEITDIENDDDPFIEVRFKEPYKSDPTKDLYIGYSFTVDGGDGDDEKYPLLTYSDVDVKDALWVKFHGAEGEWRDYEGFGFGVLLMQVLMSGTFPDDAAVLHKDLGNFTTLADSEIVVPVIAQNAGTSGIENMDGTVSINGEPTQFKIELKEAAHGIGAEYPFELTVKLPEGINTGCYNIEVTIDKVNGKENGVAAISKGKVYVVSKAVAKKPLVEEVTGMWAGFCPRGYVAMQKLRDTYKDDIVLVSAHIGDALDCMDYEPVFGTVPIFPSVNLDRTYLGVDPYHGIAGIQSGFCIADLVDECAANIPVAKVNAFANIDDNILTAKSEVEFLYSGDASNFSVTYILTEDGMENSSWSQANLYAGDIDALEREPLFEPWVNGKSKVYGVVFDNAAIAVKDIVTGVDGSIPAEVVEGVKNMHSVEFDLTMNPGIQNRKKLNLIVALLDNDTGKVVNANFVPLSVAAGIEGVDTDNEMVEETARYTVDGQRIFVPQKGVNIVKYSDGTVKKIVVK